MRKKVRYKKSKRIQRNSQKLHNTRRQSPWWVFFLWVVFIGSTFYTVFYTSVMHITDVDIRGVERADRQAMINIFYEERAGENLLAIDNGNFLTFDEEHYRSRLLEMPEVRAVSVHKVFPHRLIVEIEEYDTILIVCAYDTAPEHCIILDTQTGAAHVPQKNFAPERLERNKSMRIVLQQDVFDDHFFLNKEIVNNFLLFEKNISYYADVRITDDYRAHTVGVRDFFLTTDDGWELRVDFTQDIAQVLERLRLFFDHTDLRTRRSDIAYVDMRFGERVFYKMRGTDDEEAQVDVEGERDVGDVDTQDDEE